jgi:hypothetical protein
MEKVISITSEGSLAKGLSSKLREFTEADKLFQEGWIVKSVHPVQESYQGCWTVLIVLNNPN